MKELAQYLLCFLCSTLLCPLWAHEAKDLDDSILYKIDFELPNFDSNPELKNDIMTFHTHDQEQYDCVIPKVEEKKEEKPLKDTDLYPLALLQPLFRASSCSYRIEAYWSYEICHGLHVRQYHEEREGKNVKYQEYYLGKLSDENTKKATTEWEEARTAGRKYKTTKIDNTKYPYFELAMEDGTMCDIINAPRTTMVRYVCYPHGKNEIYSFKETSSCNYEAIILTSALCMISGFRPEESKEISIKCFNSATETHKPLSMLRQELSDLSIPDDDVPVQKGVGANDAASRMFSDTEKLVLEIMGRPGSLDLSFVRRGSTKEAITESSGLPISNLAPIKSFVSGSTCMTGGTGWWKYEFCYGRYVKQFHKDDKSEVEVYLGYFDEDAHRKWIARNPEKAVKRMGFSSSMWHHYTRGAVCDRTQLAREVDVKLVCTPITSSASAVSMYLLEPKTCQYILALESPMVCDLMKIADDYGLIDEAKVDQLFRLKDTANTSDEENKEEDAESTESTEATTTETDDEIKDATESKKPPNHVEL